MTDYDPIADVRKSWDFAYEAIRQRMTAGGPPWTPKPVPDVNGLVRVLDDIKVYKEARQLLDVIGSIK